MRKPLERVVSSFLLYIGKVHCRIIQVQAMKDCRTSYAGFQ